MSDCGRSKATGRGLFGGHVDPGAQGVADVVVGADAELILGPGSQAHHGVGEAAGGPRVVLCEQHLAERHRKTFYFIFLFNQEVPWDLKYLSRGRPGQDSTPVQVQGYKIIG